MEESKFINQVEAWRTILAVVVAAPASSILTGVAGVASSGTATRCAVRSLNRRATPRIRSTAMGDLTPVPDGRRAPDPRMSRHRNGVGRDAAAQDLHKSLPDAATVSRVIEMAWEDRTPFEAILSQFALDESAVIALMRRNLKPGSFRLWRERVRGRTTKHAALRPASLSEHPRHQARHRAPQR